VAGDRPLLFSRKCSTCVFRPGNPMRLSDGRLADLVEQNRQTGTMLICHQTTYGQAEHEVMCRGYWDAYADVSDIPQIMERLFGADWYDEVDPLD
jgi:hypothetical protein